LIKKEHSIISPVQLQHNNGHNHDQPADHLQGRHHFAQKHSGNNSRRLRFERCSDAGMDRLYPFDSFEIETKWQYGSANADKQYPPPLNERVSVEKYFQGWMKDIPQQGGEQQAVKQDCGSHLNQLKSSDALIKKKFGRSPGYGKQNGGQGNINVPQPGL
jgi:hypothetical protein